MIQSGVVDRVGFMSIGVTGTRARDWSGGGRAFAKLEAAMQVATAKKIRFDYVFWYQGLSDGNAREQEYAADLTKVMRALIPSAPSAKWIVAKSSGCDREINNEILAAQRAISSNNLFNRFPGPDVYILQNSFLRDQCTLTDDGQEKMAELWYHSFVKAEAASQKYAKESLLHYFK
jgi:hypothetical protein